jgi:hypothetical protein
MASSGFQHEPGTREALFQEIDDVSSDLTKWQDRDYYAHKRWHNAAIYLPILLFTVAVASAIAGALAGKTVAAVVSAIAVALAALASRLGCQNRADYYAHHGNVVVTCNRRASALKAKVTSDPRSVEDGFKQLDGLFDEARSLRTSLGTDTEVPQQRK